MKKENRDKIVALRHDLHCHPELSMQEQETKNRLITFIKENIQLEVIDRGNWFYVQYTTKRQSEMPEADTKPPIAFRADFDALPILEDAESLPYASENPGVSHKCGHDGHASALAGLALELDANGADRDVYLIFQHAGRNRTRSAGMYSVDKRKKDSGDLRFSQLERFSKGSGCTSGRRQPVRFQRSDYYVYREKISCKYSGAGKKSISGNRKTDFICAEFITGNNV